MVYNGREYAERGSAVSVPRNTGGIVILKRGEKNVEKKAGLPF